jgi:hypothetical protein
LDISHDVFAHQEAIGFRRMACTSRESRVLLSTSCRLSNGFEKKFLSDFAEGKVRLSRQAGMDPLI